MASILVVDDEPKMTSLICGHLEDARHRVTTTTKPAEALELIEKHSFDIIVTDLSMPEISGMEVLEAGLKKEGTGVIMMTAYGTVETAVEAMKKGAADYLVKPFPLDELQMVIDRLLESQKLKSLSSHYQSDLDKRAYGRFIGSAAATERATKMIAQVAATDTSVLLTGGSGTGKELAARMVHDLSPRKDKPFIAVNCAALTETLLESELFGHEKGAFTGAVGRKRGRFELADGGTIFLDEIGETSPGMQSKLLRVLEERNLVRVGGVDLIDVDVRVVAATNRSLKEEMQNGKFREDLYYRLNVFPIKMPSLIERKDDIAELSRYFLEQLNYAYTDLDTSVVDLLMRYDWPGNIRELKNVLERAVILSGGEPLTVDEFSLEIDDSPLVTEGGLAATAEAGLESAEKQMILDALEKAGGNKTEAARLLKITRRRLYSRMKAHGISH